VFVSAAKLDGDSRAEVITAPGTGGGPHVKIFRGSDGEVLSSFFAFESSFTGGVRVAAINTEGRADVIVGPGPGRPPLVRIFDGRQLAQGAAPESAETASFPGFDPNFAGGVFVGGAAELMTMLDLGSSPLSDS
jgi:hypothetical protein